MESNKAFPLEILLRKKIMEDTSRNPEHPAPKKVDPWRRVCEGGTARGQSILDAQTGIRFLLKYLSELPQRLAVKARHPS